MSALERLGLGDLQLDRTSALRLAVFAITCVLTALLIVNYDAVPSETLRAGDVATRTVKSPRTFLFTDFAERQRRQDDAGDAVRPVYTFRADFVGEQSAAVDRAFDDARTDLLAAIDDALLPKAVAASDLPAEVHDGILGLFRSRLGVILSDEVIDSLIDVQFSSESQALAQTLLHAGMKSYVVASRDELPVDRGPMSVSRVSEDGVEELQLNEYEGIRVPDEARQRIDVALLVEDTPRAPWVSAVTTVAHAMVRPNLRANPAETERRRDQARADVPMVRTTIQKGTLLFLDGQVLNQDQVNRYEALQAGTVYSVWLRLLAVMGFVAMLVLSLYHFGATYLTSFSTRVRDGVAVSVLLVLVALMARLTVGGADGVALLVGYEMEPESFWYAAPVAGAVMLVRLLLGVSWAVMFSVAAASVCGLVMDMQALNLVFYLVSGVTAAGAVEHTRERMSVVRAGLYVGVVNAALVLLIHFLVLFLGDGVLSQATTMRPVWSMAFALMGGLLSTFVVLGLMPVFERAGFVTDYQLLELANLDHPLMRQLMLRAPGSYHHSVVVGSLAEAACDAVGANALQARVSAYFHDIGKALKPSYFVENQGKGGNRHEGLDTYTSAHIIISHVTDGARMAREHRLPKPIIENVLMHHGTGILQYFYAQAIREADNPLDVNDADFRYPGPKPNNREAGIIMLADKVEAATRTIQDPNEDKFRQMIGSIINSVMADGQFSECPLTFQELYVISDSFVGVLNGIHHQRIEYPQTAAISRGRDVPPPSLQDAKVITLEIPTEEALRAAPGLSPESRQPSARLEADTEPDNEDYEAIEHLPRGGDTGAN